MLVYLTFSFCYNRRDRDGEKAQSEDKEVFPFGPKSKNEGQYINVVQKYTVSLLAGFPVA